MKKLWTSLVIATVLPLGGCANMDQTQHDTAKGAGIFSLVSGPLVENNLIRKNSTGTPLGSKV